MNYPPNYFFGFCWPLRVNVRLAKNESTFVMANPTTTPEEVSQLAGALKEWSGWAWGLIGGVFGFGITYGTMQAKVAGFDKKFEEIAKHVDKYQSDAEERFRRIAEECKVITANVNARFDDALVRFSQENQRQHEILEARMEKNQAQIMTLLFAIQHGGGEVKER